MNLFIYLSIYLSIYKIKLKDDLLLSSTKNELCCMMEDGGWRIEDCPFFLCLLTTPLCFLLGGENFIIHSPFSHIYCMSLFVTLSATFAPTNETNRV
jgi:hypothetical protein